jgi:16S rRNA (guanine527-N7)-methyltransferase
MTGAVDQFVSRETSEDLQHYAALLKKWNAAINLIAPSTVDQVWDRHIRDSLQIAANIPKNTTSWVDLGSGGGLPGLVVAIVAKHNHPDLRITLVESDQRKCSFLRTVIRELGLNATVTARRIEDIPPLQPDVISARALAALPLLLRFFHHHATSKTVGIFPKGEKWQAELAEAQQDWRFSFETAASTTDENAVIFFVKEVTPCKP